MDPKEIYFSFSLLKQIKRSPLTAIRMKERPVPSTAGQLYNIAIEIALQEPERFEKEYHVLLPEDGKSDRKGTNAWKAAEMKYGRGKVLKANEYDKIMFMRKSWEANKELQEVYSKGQPQLRLLWKHKEVKCKGFADWYSHAFPSINDIKVVNDASDDAVAAIIARQLYDIQAAIYRAGAAHNGLHVEASFITFVEKEYPYMVNAIELSEEQLSFGYDMYMEYIELWRKCLESNNFPGYSEGFHQVNLPGWHSRKYLEKYYGD